MCEPPGLVEVLHDAGHVVDRDEGGIGVAAVDRELHLRPAPGEQVTTEVLPDPQDEDGTPGIDDARDFVVPREPGDLLEGARPGEPRNQFARGLRAVLVEDRDGNPRQVEGRGITEDESLDERWNQKGHAPAGVHPEREELLPEQRQYPGERRHRRVLVTRQVRARKPAAIAASAAALGTITLHTSPARNTVCRMEMK